MQRFFFGAFSERRLQYFPTIEKIFFRSPPGPPFSILYLLLRSVSERGAPLALRRSEKKKRCLPTYLEDHGTTSGRQVFLRN